MIHRHALRAALVVSGLSTVAGCGGTARLEEESASTSGSDTSGSDTSDGSSNTSVTVREPCDADVEPTTQACCEARGARAWDAASSTCLWVAVPGPFVPPPMIG